MPEENDTTPLTHAEFARRGAQATNTKYSKEQRSEWAKRGPEALKKKHGEDYFKRMAKERGLSKKGLDAIKKKKKPQNPLRTLLGLK